MDMTGERLIPASKQAVWKALNDPEILKACIPGCESLEAGENGDLKARAAIKIGPISAKFTGIVKLSDLDPPNGYTLSGEGQGGMAGFAKGKAMVNLDDTAEGTMLNYTVNAQVGGKIAQLGARLIDATAKSLAEQFFTKFVTCLAAPADMNDNGQVYQSSAMEPPTEGYRPAFSARKLNLKIWTGATIIAAIILTVLLRM